jgi:hypothetical protein
METSQLQVAPVERRAITTGAVGLQLQTLDDVWRFATCLTKSGLAPKGIDTAEAIVIAIQMGMEVGLPPMAAMQNIAVINGRPSIWGDAQLAVVRGTRELEIFEEWYEQGGQKLPRNPAAYTDDTTAVCRVKRRGYEPQESGYSVADAKRAGLWGKSGPWTQTPFRMLRMRARSFALRDAFGDALRGMRTAEEVQDEARPVEGRVVEPAVVPFLAAPAAEVIPETATNDEPAKRTRRTRPEAPPLQLVGDAPSRTKGITAALKRAGLEWSEVERVLIENDILAEATPLDAIDDGVAAQVTAMLPQVIDIARQLKAAA